MVSLLIDTTGPQAFIGIAENGTLVSKIIISEGRQLSKFLLPSIQSILQERRGHCKATAPKKIDDFDASFQGQLAGLSCLGRADETMPEWAGEEARREMAPKGRFLGAHEFCNGLYTPNFIAIGTGPGSFTGSRVGGIVAHSLSYGWNIPLISFSSTLLPDLDAIAAQSWEKYLSGERSAQIELVYISSTP